MSLQRKTLFIAIVLLLLSWFGYQKYFGAYLFSYNKLVWTDSHKDHTAKEMVLLQQQFPVADRAKEIHQRLQIIDMHADTTLWDVDILQQHTKGHLDLPRLQQGNIGLQVFSAVTKISYELLLGDHENVGEWGDPITTIIQGGNWPSVTYHNYLARSLYHSSKLQDVIEQSDGQLKLITSRTDLLSLFENRRSGKKTVGALLALEGIYTEGCVDDFATLFNAGFRMASLTHFLDNSLGGASNGITKYGLTAEGQQMIHLMQKYGMVVDVAHVSSAVLTDILEISKQPIVRSHGGVLGAKNCSGHRNLSDQQIIAIANTGGVIGIGFWLQAVCGDSATDIAETIRYVVEMLDDAESFNGDSGLDHVGFGSDFDGLVTTPFDAAHLNQLTQALLDQGFDEKSIQKIAGGNVLRVLHHTLPDVATHNISLTEDDR